MYDVQTLLVVYDCIVLDESAGRASAASVRRGHRGELSWMSAACGSLWARCGERLVRCSYFTHLVVCAHAVFNFLTVSRPRTRVWESDAWPPATYTPTGCPVRNPATTLRLLLSPAIRPFDSSRRADPQLLAHPCSYTAPSQLRAGRLVRATHLCAHASIASATLGPPRRG